MIRRLLCWLGFHVWRHHWALPAWQCKHCLKLGDVDWNIDTEEELYHDR